LEKILRQSVYEVNNLSDREREKYERMQVRFNRTQRFLDYLTKEEDREFDRFGISRLPKPLSEKFMPVIQDRFKADREYIEKRLQEGRVEDTPLRIDEFPAVQFELASLDIDSEGSEGEKAYRK
jgi:ATP-dependent protease HslVU (ClpYQ) ATPase subunit